jgi:hypothetical protein
MLPLWQLVQLLHLVQLVLQPLLLQPAELMQLLLLLLQLLMFELMPDELLQPVLLLLQMLLLELMPAELLQPVLLLLHLLLVELMMPFWQLVQLLHLVQLVLMLLLLQPAELLFLPSCWCTLQVLAWTGQSLPARSSILLVAELAWQPFQRAVSWQHHQLASLSEVVLVALLLMALLMLALLLVVLVALLVVVMLLMALLLVALLLMALLLMALLLVVLLVVVMLLMLMLVGIVVVLVPAVLVLLLVQPPSVVSFGSAAAPAHMSYLLYESGLAHALSDQVMAEASSPVSCNCLPSLCQEIWKGTEAYMFHLKNPGSCLLGLQVWSLTGSG